jgi:hypothetical protein
MEGPVPDTQQLWLLWVSFLISQCVFLGILLFLSPDGDADLVMVIALGAVGLFEILFGLFGVPLVMWKSPAQTAYLVRWALHEAGVVSGFALVFVGGPMPVFLGLLGVSFIAMWLTRPTADAVTAWEMRRLGDDQQ